MKIELDLSPTLINRTAIGYIGRDIRDATASLGPQISYFGSVWDREPSGDIAATLVGQLGKMLAEGPPLKNLPFTSVHTAIQAPDRRVFLDPLYVLFHELRPSDLVLVLDLSVVTSPQWHSPAVARLYEAAFSRIARIQPKLLAISQNTADAYAANYGYPKRDIEVIRLYVPDHLKRRGDIAVPAKTQVPYFLFVGSQETRKNIVGAIRAFNATGLGTKGFEFVIAGGRGHGFEDIEREAAKGPGVILAGRVDDDHLRTLYKNASGFIYPSFLEGFGVPLLEALQYGLPTVTSVTGACPEVSGGQAACVDPDDIDAIAIEILKIAEIDCESRLEFANIAAKYVDENFSKHRFQRHILNAVGEF